ncbi:MAG TPA: COX15/CtaA family protein [Gaiellales bacterium]
MAISVPIPTRLRRGVARILPHDRAGFATLSGILVLAMYLNVASGAFVRLSGSGLGCPDWPLCHGGPVPPAQYHAVIEFSNRAIALAGIVTALVTWFVSRTLADRLGRWLCAGVAIGTLFQIPLGAITVLTDLNPYFVMSHFLLAITVLGLSSICWARATLRDDGFAAGPRVSLVAVGTAVLGFCLIVSGAFSTAAGPHSGGSDIRRIGNLVDTTYVHVRVATAFAVAVVLLLILLWRRERHPARLGQLTTALLVLLPLQAFIGEYQWHNQLPWGVVLAHVSVAGLVWIAIVFFATGIVARRAVAGVDAHGIARATD